MPGAPEPLYVLARRVLLDALKALGDQQDAVILVGAQAVYLHTGEADLAVAEYTTDGDIAIDPSSLKSAPRLEESLTAAGFTQDLQEVGRWLTTRQLDVDPVTVKVDLLVPEAVGGPGRRAARIGDHGKRTARKARGLEAALLDWNRLEVGSLDETDDRRFEIKVAGPSALLVAKLHKIAERVDEPGRAVDKDALDVLRLLRAVPIETLAGGLRRLAGEELTAPVTTEAGGFLRDLFGKPTSPGSQMASRAAAPLEDEDTIRQSCAALAGELLIAMTGESSARSEEG
jgi:hypothetical protein